MEEVAGNLSLLIAWLAGWQWQPGEPTQCQVERQKWIFATSVGRSSAGLAPTKQPVRILRRKTRPSMHWSTGLAQIEPN